MSVTATARHHAQSPHRVAWAVLDDFPNVADWADGVERSYATGDGRPTGLGAQRRCHLGGRRRLDEHIVAYEDGSSLTVEVRKAEGMPMRSARVTFSVAADGPDRSTLTVDLDVVPSMPAPVVALLRPLLSRMMARQFGAMLVEWAAESERRTGVGA